MLDLSAIGAFWLTNLLGLLLSTGLLLLLCRALDAWLGRALPAAARLLLYLPVFLRLLAPLELSVPLPASAQLVMPPLMLDGLSVQAQASPSSVAAVGGVYLLGVLGLLGMWAVRWTAIVSIVRSSEPHPDLPVRLHPEHGPFVFGLVRPSIVLPRTFAVPEVQGHILRHEQAHIQRGDLWLSLALDAVLSLSWPVAPVWLAAQRVRQLMEVAADELAVRHLSRAERLAYGETLLSLPTPRIPGAVGMSAYHSLEERIMSIRRPPTLSWPRAALGGAAVLALSVFACDDPEATGAPQGEDVATRTVGSLESAEIDDAIRGHLDRIRYCYQRVLSDAPTLSGKIAVQFTIAPDGVVEHAELAETTMGSPAVEHCVVERFYDISFPAPGDGSVVVTYPFVFEPG